MPLCGNPISHHFEDKKKAFFCFPAQKAPSQGKTLSSLNLANLRLGNTNAVRHLKKPSLGTQVGGYSGTLHMRASSQSSANDSDTPEESLSVVDALRTARVHLALSGVSDHVSDQDPSNDTLLKRAHRDRVLQGEQLSVVVQLDVAATFHPAVLRAMQELDCQVSITSRTHTVQDSRASPDSTSCF